MNPLLNTDSYKFSHWQQYPQGATHVNSYIEAREGGDYGFTLFFGLQMFLREFLQEPFTHWDIKEAAQLATAHGFNFNIAGFNLMLAKHKGFWPVKVQAVKEGTVLPTGNVLVQVVNTDPEFPWVTSYLETALLRAVWYPTTVATRSKRIKAMIQTYISSTSDDPSQIAFKLHDFGSRGVSSQESAGLGGAAHLVNFMGTDTVEGLVYARRYYAEDMAGYSIPAAEHSTITSWGRENEATAYANMVRTFGGSGKLYAVVSDSYDLDNAVRNIWGEQLQDLVRTTGGTVVVRPDSGDPTIVPVQTVAALAEKFGFTVNSKGYKVLDPCVKVIQGDGINEKSVSKILANLADAGFAVDNIAFGMGGELLQTPNRDTLRFAMKASAIKVDGEWRDVYKEPKTDTTKTSKRGILDLVKSENNWIKTIRAGDSTEKSLLETVYENGRLLRVQTMAEIRELSNQ